MCKRTLLGRQGGELAQYHAHMIPKYRGGRVISSNREARYLAGDDGDDEVGNLLLEDLVDEELPGEGRGGANSSKSAVLNLSNTARKPPSNISLQRSCFAPGSPNRLRHKHPRVLRHRANQV